MEDQENTSLFLEQQRTKFYSPEIKEMQGFLWMPPDCSPRICGVFILRCFQKMGRHIKIKRAADSAALFILYCLSGFVASVYTCIFNFS